MADLITPRVLKGFRDFLPDSEIERRLLSETLERQFRSYGFVPIDTPALEYTEILLGKGGGETEKQIYRFQDHGGRDISLRFDLTVPFARFMAEHRNELNLPFKRYHIAKVWRGENTQRGRYREFTQCDFDIVGTDSATADFEILLLMRNCLRAIGVSDVTIRLNHRGVFNRFLERYGLRSKSVEILRTVDKLSKIGQDATFGLLNQLTGSENSLAILDFIEPKASFDETLTAMITAAGGAGSDTDRLAQLRGYMVDAGVADIYTLDPSITRGLDYYTGVVYETFLNDLPSIGSVCSGGRYDDLANLYTAERLPGVGSSIGIDRLIAALEALGRSSKCSSFAEVAVACLNEAQGGQYQLLAERLRQSDIACEVFCDPKKITQQYLFAERKGLKWVLTLMEDDREFKRLKLRDLATRTDYCDIDVAEVAALVGGSKIRS